MVTCLGGKQISAAGQRQRYYVSHSTQLKLSFTFPQNLFFFLNFFLPTKQSVFVSSPSAFSEKKKKPAKETSQLPIFSPIHQTFFKPKKVTLFFPPLTKHLHGFSISLPNQILIPNQGLLFSLFSSQIKGKSKMMESKSPVCNTCGEEIGVKPNGDFFVACHECSFPICKACLEYEFKEGRRICLRCGNPYDGNSDFLQLGFS